MDKNGLKLSSLELTCVGGAACPPSVTEAFEERYGVEIRHMWGMTEVSPIGSLGALKVRLSAVLLDKNVALGK